MSESERY